MGSWTGKYDPIRQIGDATKKVTGVDLSPLNRIHSAISNKAHSAADTYLNQEPEGSENKGKKSKGTGMGNADYSGAVSKARLRADNARKLTIMRSI